MAIIEDLGDAPPSPPRPTPRALPSNLPELCMRLVIPSGFATPAPWASNSEEEQMQYEPVLSGDLRTWRDAAPKLLQALAELVERRGTKMDEEDRATAVVAVAPFTLEDEAWSTLESVKLARRLLPTLLTRTPRPILTHVLTSHLKPLFARNLHTSVNPATGRMLPRPRGGEGTSGYDLPEAQGWKSGSGFGSWGVLRVCLEAMSRGDVQDLWHLVVPPLITMMDDYEPFYKIRGIQLCNLLLSVSDAGLVQRTGIATLFSKSLSTALTFLTHPLSGPLLDHALPTSLRLITLTTPPASAERSNALSVLVSEGILQPWSMAGDRIAVIMPTLAHLPAIIDALGIVSARFLKAFIPHLTLLLTFPSPPTTVSLPLQVRNAKALEHVLHVCAPRVARWRGKVLDGVVRCWVGLREASAPGKAGYDELEHALYDILAALREACPEVEADLTAVHALDPLLFAPLLVTRS